MAKLPKNKMKRCHCALCKRSTIIQRILKKLSKKDADDLMKIFEDLECAEFDLDWIKCGLDKGYVKVDRSNDNENSCLIVKQEKSNG